MESSVDMIGLSLLNTVTNGFNIWLLILGIICIVTGAILTIYTLFKVDSKLGDTITISFGIIIVSIGVLLATDPYTDIVKYEVTVQDGYILDATKWEIIEQRGEIYVIKERKISKIIRRD